MMLEFRAGPENPENAGQAPPLQDCEDPAYTSHTGTRRVTVVPALTWL